MLWEVQFPSAGPSRVQLHKACPAILASDGWGPAGEPHCVLRAGERRVGTRLRPPHRRPTSFSQSHGLSRLSKLGPWQVSGAIRRVSWPLLPALVTSRSEACQLHDPSHWGPGLWSHCAPGITREQRYPSVKGSHQSSPPLPDQARVSRQEGQTMGGEGGQSLVLSSRSYHPARGVPGCDSNLSRRPPSWAPIVRGPRGGQSIHASGGLLHTHSYLQVSPQSDRAPSFSSVISA
ncbi:hypothetical protein NDU88_011734 [Pleurodeles waltl]|uniref:Uncharacterized protein n=1 Tax=Pleurodeles waltl TaxID=8319 RepID=A0AAV7S6A9_PLEWA|nr:hypothetical protein NDU88_011734 [Pleurodeles waltl]